MHLRSYTTADSTGSIPLTVCGNNLLSTEMVSNHKHICANSILTKVVNLLEGQGNRPVAEEVEDLLEWPLEEICHRCHHKHIFFSFVFFNLSQFWNVWRKLQFCGHACLCFWFNGIDFSTADWEASLWRFLQIAYTSTNVLIITCCNVFISFKCVTNCVSFVCRFNHDVT